MLSPIAAGGAIRLHSLHLLGRVGPFEALCHGAAKGCGPLTSPQNEGAARALLRLHHPKVRRPDRCPPVLGKCHDACPFSI
eukprot:2910690-Prymnesium_polylepis.1